MSLERATPKQYSKTQNLFQCLKRVYFFDDNNLTERRKYHFYVVSKTE